MSTFFSRAWVMLLLLGLVGLVFLKGVVPAWTRINADFPGYYTAAKLVLDGENTDRLYDDAWFREQIRRYGLQDPRNPGKFTPFPPPTALLLVPLAGLEPLTALRVMTVVSLLGLICSALLLARMLSWRLVDAALFTLSAGIGILSCLQSGQPYILVSTSCILGYHLYRQGRPWLGGVCLGLFVPIKYYPAIFLGYLAWRRQWKVLLGSGVVIAGVGLLSIAVLGWPLHRDFLFSVLGNHLAGRLSHRMQGVPFTAVYQSFDTLFDRLFVFDPVGNPQPLVAAPVLRTLGVILTKGLIVLAAVMRLAQLARKGHASALAPSIGILGILVLLLAPATASYMCVLLWLPVALLINHFFSLGARVPAYLTLATYVAIGFIPYDPYRFEGHGGLTVLAFPRLFLELVMFIGCIYFLTPSAESSAGAAAPSPSDRDDRSTPAWGQSRQ